MRFPSQTENLVVGKSRFGRGVFARKPLARGRIIEVAPVVVIKGSEVKPSHRLQAYIFDWGPNCSAVALGLGSLFNHSTTPNVGYHLDKRRKVIAYVALRALKKGEECFIDYGYDPREQPYKKTSCDR